MWFCRAQNPDYLLGASAGYALALGLGINHQTCDRSMTIAPQKERKAMPSSLMRDLLHCAYSMPIPSTNRKLHSPWWWRQGVDG